MEEIIDLIATDASASEISDKIKEVLFTKSAERIEASRPAVAASLFGPEGTGEDNYQEEE